MDYTEIFCDNVIKAGKPICITAAGTSMWPLISEGMKAEIVPVASNLPGKGSLLLVDCNNKLVVHRYWGLADINGVTMVLTKGDTNLGFDQPIPVAKVLGQVILLKSDTEGGPVLDPNKGMLQLYGKVICSSQMLARIWARICRIVLRIKK